MKAPGFRDEHHFAAQACSHRESVEHWDDFHIWGLVFVSSVREKISILDLVCISIGWPFGCLDFHFNFLVSIFFSDTSSVVFKGQCEKNMWVLFHYSSLRDKYDMGRLVWLLYEGWPISDMPCLLFTPHKSQGALFNLLVNTLQAYVFPLPKTIEVSFNSE